LAYLLDELLLDSLHVCARVLVELLGHIADPNLGLAEIQMSCSVHL